MKLGPETLEQIALFDWIRTQPKIAPYSIHIANERKTSFVNGKILQKMGVMPGVSDIFIGVAIKPYHGLWLELKAGKNKPTPLQKDFLKLMSSAGYYSGWRTGFENARQFILDYLALEKK